MQINNKDPFRFIPDSANGIHSRRLIMPDFLMDQEGKKETTIVTNVVRSGVGGSRTRVQTWRPYAFYMLSSACFS